MRSLAPRRRARVGVSAGQANLAGMARAPDTLTLGRHRDLEGREKRPLLRWGILGALGLLLVLGLGNAFGQRPHTDTASVDGVELEVYSPRRLRSGLFFMSRFTIRAEQELG